MSSRDNSLALLPNGFADTLSPKAEQEAQVVSTLMKTFGAYGYRLIKPPLLEFEDSLFAEGPGSSLSQETFRLMDPVSHRMMGIRADITPQIARIALSRLVNEARPLRLMYANDVLRTKGTQIRTERQFTQVGCELICDGQNNLDNEIEICVLSVLGLQAIGIENITIDFTIPGFVADVLEGYDAQDRDDVLKAVFHRDHDVLAKHSHKVVQKLADVIDLKGESKDILNGLRTLKLGKEGDIENLENVISALDKTCEELGITGVSCTVDVLEQTGFEYHNGLGFTLFASDMRGELGRGGHYPLQFGSHENTQSATGFTIYMDTITRSLKPSRRDKVLSVPTSESWVTLQELQAEGWTTVRATDNTIPADTTHTYKNGKIEEIT